MKICALSDLHGNLPQLEPCDVVCICGDIAPINFDRSTDRCIYWFRTVFLKWCSELECEKVIFIADFISAERDYNGVEIMREKAKRSLDEAIVEGLSFTIKDLIDAGRIIHPDTLGAYNDAIAKSRRER